MELNQIKQFRTIAQTGNISKAAERLFIAQPSLSQTLKRLEDELGVQLFDRHGKKIVLNDAGRIFLKYCDEIALALDNAIRELAEYNNSIKKEISIVVESTTLVLLEIAEKMRRDYPWSLPHFYQDLTDDWDIRICSDISSDCGCPSEVVIVEPIGVILPKDHPLNSKKEIFKTDIADCDFLSLNPNENFYRIISHYCALADFKQNVTMYIDHPSTMQELLKRNFGIAFAPEYTWHSIYEGVMEFRTIADMPMKQFVHIIMNDQKHITKDKQICHDAIAGFYRDYVKNFRDDHCNTLHK